MRPTNYDEPKVQTHSFGVALTALKTHRRVARMSWMGASHYSFLYLVGAGRYPPTTPVGRQIAAETPDGLVPYAPYIAAKTIGGDVVIAALSHEDMLAEDWVVVV